MEHPELDDPSYLSLSALSNGSYDNPSEFLSGERSGENEGGGGAGYLPAAALSRERAPHAPSVGENSASVRQMTTHDIKSALEETGDYTEISDLSIHTLRSATAEATDPLSEEEADGDKEVKEKGGEKGKRILRVRQSFQDKHADNDMKIYVEGNIVQAQPMLSFKTRQRSVEMEQEGIYQGLVSTDEQKQQLGILPTSIYMTVTLEQRQQEMEDLSMQMQQRHISSSRSRGSKIMSVKPQYRGCILHPPPLPPLAPDSPTAQRKIFAIVENLLKSEAAFLTSLNIACQMYMRPLKAIPSPPIDKEKIKTLFGPIEAIVEDHELFYTALTTRTMEWSPHQTIGNVFMTFYRKEVIGHYEEYVNNFTDAMLTLQKGIKKKPKFVSFLKQQYACSKTSLSLQGLLLKPIQRFPQYILFLEDLIKYTKPKHPDRVTLQLALARFTNIAEHLNEAKRVNEQNSIVSHLARKVSGLPFRLTDSRNRWLYRQDVISRLLLNKEGTLVQYKRSLLLFNNMVMCASLKKGSKSQTELEATADARDFKASEGAYYTCKWFCPLDKLQVVESDYLQDIWDFVVKDDQTHEATMYRELKKDCESIDQDFDTVTKISALVPKLNRDFSGLTMSTIQNHMRVLQREMALIKDQIKHYQPGRLDLEIPSRDGSTVAQHTYVFASEKTKMEWLNTLRYAKLQLKEENKLAWIFAEDAEDDDCVMNRARYLPLYVDHYTLSNSSQLLTTECATKTHSNLVWFASGSGSAAEVAILQCATPKPILLKSFTVDCTRILSMCYAPARSSSSSSERPRIFSSSSSSSSLFPSSSSLTASTDSVWMGSLDSKLLIHSASSELAHKCVQLINFQDSITCLEYWHDNVFIATTGFVYVYRRPSGSSWDLDNPVIVRVHDGSSITCMCQVRQWLWVGVHNQCHILNMTTLKLEGRFEMCKEPDTVRRMTSSGSGVWVSFRRSATIQLHHTVTKALLQQIDILSSFLRIVHKHSLETKLADVSRVHITALLVSKGYLWVGTSTGATLVYRTPLTEGVPISSGKPYLATDAHHSSVRVILTTHTLATMTSSRLSQFISDEQERYQEDWEVGEGLEGSFTSFSPANDSYVFGNASFPRRASVALSSIPPSIPEKQEMEQEREEEREEEGREGSVTPPPLPSLSFFDDQRPSTGTIVRKGRESDAVDEEDKSRVSSVPDSDTGDTPPGAESGNHSPPAKPPRRAMSANFLTTVAGKEEMKEEREVAENEEKMETEEIAVETKPETRDSNDLPEVPGTQPAVGDHTPSPRAPTGGSSTSSGPQPEGGKESERNPDEDLRTFRRHPSPELYDDVSEDQTATLTRRQTRSPSPYEDPATLDLTGPIPVRPMPEFSNLDQMTVDRHTPQAVAGAIYVLMGGRGLVNLRPGKRRSMYSMALSGSDSTISEESCVVAYELKYGNM